MLKISLLIGIVLLSGCTSTEQYKLYADSHAQMETAKYNAEAAKYKAMSDIANNGTEAAKVAAVMAIALGGNSGGGNKTNGLQAPQQSEALQWAQILVPNVVQGIGIIANRQVAINQSNNAAAVAVSTNSTFLGMAGKIQAPAANVSNVDNHTQTLSGTGTLGSGTYGTTATSSSTTDNHTQTLSGTGTLGSGAYNTAATDNHAQTLSGSGTLGSGAYTTTNPVVVVPDTVVITPVIQ